MMNFDPRTVHIPKWAMLLMAGMTAITILLNIMPFASHIFVSYNDNSVYAIRQNQQLSGSDVPFTEWVSRQSH